MSTEFLRLYRVLSRKDPNSKVDDVHYTKERKAVLQALGHDIGEVAEPVPLPKYHGRAARRFGSVKRQKAIGVDSKQEALKMKEFFNVSTKASKIYAITKEMQDFMAKSEPISNRVWQKYNAVFDSTNELNEPNSSTTKAKLPHIDTKSKSTQSPTNITIKRPYATLRRDFTSHKWSTAEIERINQIYYMMPRPKQKNIRAWKEYYLEFASRFQSFYPSRKTDEIVEKIQDMITTRKIKEPGEVEYWDEVHLNNRNNKVDAAANKKGEK